MDQTNIPGDDEPSAKMLISQLRDLQQRYDLPNIVVTMFDDVMRHHAVWSVAYGPYVSSLAVQEVVIGVLGRIISMAKEPLLVIDTAEQMLLNTVTHYVHNQSKRPDQLQILAALLERGATVPAITEEQRKTLS